MVATSTVTVGELTTSQALIVEPADDDRDRSGARGW
jgi:hypothetical protein